MKQRLQIRDILRNGWLVGNRLKFILLPTVIFILLISTILKDYYANLMLTNAWVKNHLYAWSFYLKPAIEGIIITPAIMGTVITAAKHFRGTAIYWYSPFLAYKHVITIAATFFIVSLIGLLPTNIMYLNQLHLQPGFHQAMAYAFELILASFMIIALPIAAEKNLAPWKALSISLAASTYDWGKLFGLVILSIFIMMLWALILAVVAAVSHGNVSIVYVIGAVTAFWLLPFYLASYGVLYQRLIELTYGEPTE